MIYTYPDEWIEGFEGARDITGGGTGCITGG